MFVEKSLEQFELNVVSNPDCSDFFVPWQPEDARHSLNQSESKLKPITSWKPAFSRVLDSLVVVFFLLGDLIGSVGFCSFPFL